MENPARSSEDTDLPLGPPPDDWRGGPPPPLRSGGAAAGLFGGSRSRSRPPPVSTASYRSPSAKSSYVTMGEQLPLDLNYTHHHLNTHAHTYSHTHTKYRKKLWVYTCDSFHLSCNKLLFRKNIVFHTWGTNFCICKCACVCAASNMPVASPTPTIFVGSRMLGVKDEKISVCGLKDRRGKVYSQSDIFCVGCVGGCDLKYPTPNIINSFSYPITMKRTQVFPDTLMII